MRAEKHHVACDHAGMIVHHRRQPRPCRPATSIEDEDVEFGVVGLPDRVRAIGAMTMDHLVFVAESGSALMRERQHRRIDPAHDIANAAVGRRVPSIFASDMHNATMDGCDRGRRLRQRHALDQLDQTVRKLAHGRSGRARPIGPLAV